MISTHTGFGVYAVVDVCYQNFNEHLCSNLPNVARSEAIFGVIIIDFVL
jgi:hypothetical protein